MEERKEKTLVLLSPDSEKRKALVDALDVTMEKGSGFVVVEPEGRNKVMGSHFMPIMLNIMGRSGWGIPSPSPFFPSKPKRVKLCLVCKKEHTHNNAFCSAECCRAYKLKKKKGGSSI